MIVVSVTPIVTKDRSSDRLHRRYRETISDPDVGLSLDRMMTDERCQGDQSGSFDEVPGGGRADRGDGIPQGTPDHLICQFCWPARQDTL